MNAIIKDVAEVELLFAIMPAGAFGKKIDSQSAYQLSWLGLVLSRYYSSYMLSSLTAICWLVFGGSNEQFMRGAIMLLMLW